MYLLIFLCTNFALYLGPDAQTPRYPVVLWDFNPCAFTPRAWVVGTGGCFLFWVVPLLFFIVLMTEWRRRFQDPSLVPSCADQSQFEVRGVLLCRSRSTCFSILPKRIREAASATKLFWPPRLTLIVITSSAFRRTSFIHTARPRSPNQW